MRTSLKTFATTMEEVLKANDWKGGWDDESIWDLLKRLEEEVKELKEVMDRYQHIQDNNAMEAMEPS